VPPNGLFCFAIANTNALMILESLELMQARRKNLDEEDLRESGA